MLNCETYLSLFSAISHAIFKKKFHSLVLCSGTIDYISKKPGFTFDWSPQSFSKHCQRERLVVLLTTSFKMQIMKSNFFNFC